MTSSLSLLDAVENDVAGQVEMDRALDQVRAGTAHPHAVHEALVEIWQRHGDPGLRGAARRVQVALERAATDSLRAHLSSPLKTVAHQWTKAEQMRAGYCMRELGFVRKRSGKPNKFGVREWIYVKGDASTKPSINDSGAKRASGDEQDVPLLTGARP